jgi:demethylmenaquinone methyltransferase / 2-methoxy-6-polyprenyl-1,4-benzoquinol methylase
MDRMEEGDRSRRVRDMFGTIAGRYDFLNHFLSANVDRYWRQICVREVSKSLSVPIPRILDIGCGTADLALAFSKLGPVAGCDFCHPMLRIGAQKTARTRDHNPIWLLGADALELPFAHSSFDAVVSAFVLRNLANIGTGLREMRRVLRPGGVVGILDFGMPQKAFWASVYRFYFLRVLPRIGKIISGVDGPYGYLPASVQSFPPAGELKSALEDAGFTDVRYHLLTGGVAVLLVGIAKQNYFNRGLRG